MNGQHPAGGCGGACTCQDHGDGALPRIEAPLEPRAAQQPVPHVNGVPLTWGTGC